MTDDNLIQPPLPDLEAALPAAGPVTCLGLTFPDDDARRTHLSARLATEWQYNLRPLCGYRYGKLDPQ